MATIDQIKIDPMGIGAVLKRHRLVVPMNQREYSWEESHVKDLFEDLQKAIDGAETTYFLGAIALTGTDPELPEVTDGQQRLATTSLLLAAMRDYFFEHNDDMNVEHLEQTFLRSVDPDEGHYPPRLTLNMEDREFFRKFVCTRPGDPIRKADTERTSHRLLKQAIDLSKARVSIIVQGHSPANKTKQLRKWIKFIETSAVVIVLRMPSEMNAYRMFDTLNDRGRRTTQLDIVKNYLFQEADNRKPDAQPLWSKMTGLLETLEIDDIALTFLRHAASTSFGLVRKPELFETIEKHVSGKARVITFMTELAEMADDYVALMWPDSKKWNDYPAGTRNHLKALLYLRVVPIRPVLLAVARHFSTTEAAKAFRYAISVVVRFLIVGGARGETVEDAYASRAQDIAAKRIKTAKELAAALAPVVPSDAEFEAAFQVARVSKSYLARYYLRAMEMMAKGNPEPEWLPNDDSVINLEHVLPENPGANWPDIPPDSAAAVYNRIGNLVLLQASKNSLVGNAHFDDKRATLKASTYLLTAEVGKCRKWSPKEIDERQTRLATLAVTTWPLAIR